MPNPELAAAASALADCPVLALLDVPVSRRKAFASAAAQGMAVGELSPVDLKAAPELFILAPMVFNDENAMGAA
jgi:chromosome partitioning protein